MAEIPERGKRKRVSMDFGSPPIRAAPPRLKHRIFTHQKNQIKGVTMKASTTSLRAHMGKNPDCKVRVLGAELVEIPQESPPSLLAEDASGDLLERLERRIVALEQDKEASLKRLKSLEKDKRMFMLFLEDGQRFCLRAFADKVLQVFYDRAEKGSLTFEERSRWLFGNEAVFFVDRGGNLALLDGSIPIDRECLKLMRHLRQISKSVSRVAHSAKPIEVAYALDKLPNVDTSLIKLFQTCFGVSPKGMIKTFEEKGSTLDPKFTLHFDAGGGPGVP